MVICLERGADLHTVQLTPLPLTVSCFSKIQIGFTFLVPAYLGSPGKGPLNACVCVTYFNMQMDLDFNMDFIVCVTHELVSRLPVVVVLLQTRTSVRVPTTCVPTVSV